ncbi:MAG TPA: hypothetical protein VD815_02150 [Candidatus Saccharimonadales bacterium]|nr:hypothetical protein [Candidatus Saccharimonadales bacterium]
MKKDYVDISNTTRRQSILNFITLHPSCSVEDVVRRLKDEEIASRMTVRHVLEELIDEGTITKVKDKNNSRSVKLYVDPQNLLVTVPQNLEEIFLRFESFIDKVGKISQNKDEIKLRMANSIFEETIDKNGNENTQMEKWGDSLASIPFVILDIINDVFTFSFLFLFPKKNVGFSSFSKVYSAYFERLAKMYSSISSKLADVHSTQYDTTSEHFRYVVYLESKEKPGFKKVGFLAYMCYRYNIAKEMYEVLDLLWIKNIDAVSLLYDRSYMDLLFMDYNSRCDRASSDRFSASHLEYLEKYNEHLSYNNEILNKIHEAVNLYIVLERFLPDVENWRVSSSG